MRHVLPLTWAQASGRSTVGGVALEDLAREYGTPLQLFDEAHIEARLARFREAFGAETALAYAGKAFLCGALVDMLDRAGWWIDVVSGGELELVRRAGFPLDRVILHGNAKSPAEIRAAIELGVGRIVVDHAGEIEFVLEAARTTVRTEPVDVLLRLNLDVTPDTHEKVKTVGPSAHFGFEPEQAARAAARFDDVDDVRLLGVHIHAGSQIRDVELFERLAQAVVDFVEPERHHFADPLELDLGGGLAAPYVAADTDLDPAAYATAVRSGLERAGAEERLGDYRLAVEPGRSVIANAAITLYRVQARKHLSALGPVLAVDGGLSDNPRPSLYGAAYEVLNVTRPANGGTEHFRIVGRHCESGDVVSRGSDLPADSDVGDLLAIPATGAYVFAMASRYNGVGRPAVVFVRDGAARLAIRRETMDDLLTCDVSLVAPNAALPG